MKVFKLTNYPRVPEYRTKNKEKITATVDHPVGDKLRDIMNESEYANFSAVTNKVLKAGLKSLGYEIEA